VGLERQWYYLQRQMSYRVIFGFNSQLRRRKAKWMVQDGATGKGHGNFIFAFYSIPAAGQSASVWLSNSGGN